MDLLHRLKKFDKLIEIAETPRIKLNNNYYQMKLRGTHPKMFLREAVWMVLQEAAEKLPHPYIFFLFDTYRSVETQKHLFEYMLEEITKLHPQLPEEEKLQQTRLFVSDPFDAAKVHLLSHPSGGSVDLTLYNIETKQEVDMSTGFDDPSPESATHFFTVHPMRDLLYKTMMDAGFTNYSKEWWHYDLGNYSWAKKKHADWYYTTI